MILLKHEPERRLDHVLGVAHSVDSTDLVAVSRRDIDLDDFRLALDQLKKDLGVEVKIIGIERKPNARERLGRIRAIPGVPLAEPDARKTILQARQDPVADILVDRHATAKRRVSLPEPHTEYAGNVGIGLEWAQQLRQHPRRVLVVTVKHDDHVEPFPYRVGVTDLLVSSIALIHPILHYANVLQSHACDTCARHFDCAVLGGVVNQEDFGARAIQIARRDVREDSFDVPLSIVRENEDQYSHTACPAVTSRIVPTMLLTVRRAGLNIHTTHPAAITPAGTHISTCAIGCSSMTDMFTSVVVAKTTTPTGACRRQLFQKSLIRTGPRAPAIRYTNGNTMTTPETT